MIGRLFASFAQPLVYYHRTRPADPTSYSPQTHLMGKKGISLLNTPYHVTLEAAVPSFVGANDPQQDTEPEGWVSAMLPRTKHGAHHRGPHRICTNISSRISSESLPVVSAMYPGSSAIILMDDFSRVFLKKAGLTRKKKQAWSNQPISGVGRHWAFPLMLLRPDPQHITLPNAHPDPPTFHSAIRPTKGRVLMLGDDDISEPDRPTLHRTRTQGCIQAKRAASDRPETLFRGTASYCQSYVTIFGSNMIILVFPKAPAEPPSAWDEPAQKEAAYLAESATEL
ncbi:hypothetical protein ACRALDRAFT_205073 [Sodiomyces alcalophilus JCM 7366]|uniref:uncharacterized protein n=1 Tax=Sodiomyces alcalophilus JCM 7366 TaxID=591952 RepID=UPI0039B4B048